MAESGPTPGIPAPDMGPLKQGHMNYDNGLTQVPLICDIKDHTYHKAVATCYILPSQDGTWMIDPFQTHVVLAVLAAYGEGMLSPVVLAALLVSSCIPRLDSKTPPRPGRGS